jgi:hypothetical protein
VTNLPANAPVRICGISVVNVRVVFASGTNIPTDEPRVMKTTDGGHTNRARVDCITDPMPTRLLHQAELVMVVDPKDLTAQMLHRAAGNPPSTLPLSAVSNFFPGLEFDFRNIWRRIFVGIELHEAGLAVTLVEPGSPAAAQGIEPGFVLLEVNGQPVYGDVINSAGTKVGATPLEWSNALAIRLAPSTR